MQSKDRANVATWRAMLYANFHLLRILADEMMAQQNLELSWYEVLLHVEEASGPISQRDLQERVMLGQSGLSRLLTRMESAELIRRVTVDTDRRTLSVELTARGRERLRRAAPVHLAGIRRWFGDQLTTQESETLRTGLEKVLGNLTADRARQPVPVQPVALSTPLAAEAISVADALAVLDTLEPLVIADAAKYATAADVVDLRKLLGVLARNLNATPKFVSADWAMRLRTAQISPNEALRQVYGSLVAVVVANLDLLAVEGQSGLDPLPQRLQRQADLVETIAKSDK